MGVTHLDAPQWFLSSFLRSARGAGATASDAQIRAVGQGLLNRWDQPERRFHNLRHLADVLGRVDELAEETHEPDVVRLAAWYHGAVFGATDADRRGAEDKGASARLAVLELAEIGIPPHRTARVAQLVTAMMRHAPDPTDFDCAVLCDADLAMLAAEPQRYREYLRAVRDEYAHVGTEVYIRTRIDVITRLLARPAIFTSPLGAAWEEPARQNLAAELHRLRKELAALPGAGP